MADLLAELMVPTVKVSTEPGQLTVGWRRKENRDVLGDDSGTQLTSEESASPTQIAQTGVSQFAFDSMTKLPSKP